MPTFLRVGSRLVNLDLVAEVRLETAAVTLGFALLPAGSAVGLIDAGGHEARFGAGDAAAIRAFLAGEADGRVRRLADVTLIDLTAAAVRYADDDSGPP